MILAQQVKGARERSEHARTERRGSIDGVSMGCWVELRVEARVIRLVLCWVGSSRVVWSGRVRGDCNRYNK